MYQETGLKEVGDDQILVVIDLYCEFTLGQKVRANVS